MIRLIIDKLGTGHDDLFLKIDSMPSYSKTADSYYLLDFLEIDWDDSCDQHNDSEAIRVGCVELLKYWIEILKNIEKGQTRFLPFDMWDECIGGLLIEKTKLGFKTQIGFTDKIHGYEVGKSNIDKLINERQIDFKFEEKAEWLISEDSFFGGLDWSINEIKK